MRRSASYFVNANTIGGNMDEAIHLIVYLLVAGIAVNSISLVLSRGELWVNKNLFCACVFLLVLLGLAELYF